MTARDVIDWAPDPDLDRVAEIALGIAEKIREDDPCRLYGELSYLAYRHPAKLAQIAMCLAAWFNPNEPVRCLWERVESIAAAHAGRIVGVA